MVEHKQARREMKTPNERAAGKGGSAPQLAIERALPEHGCYNPLNFL